MGNSWRADPVCMKHGWLGVTVPWESVYADAVCGVGKAIQVAGRGALASCSVAGDAPVPAHRRRDRRWRSAVRRRLADARFSLVALALEEGCCRRVEPVPANA